jgi:hypothetical protein
LCRVIDCMSKRCCRYDARCNCYVRHRMNMVKVEEWVSGNHQPPTHIWRSSYCTSSTMSSSQGSLQEL